MACNGAPMPGCRSKIAYNGAPAAGCKSKIARKEGACPKRGGGFRLMEALLPAINHRAEGREVAVGQCGGHERVPGPSVALFGVAKTGAVEA